MLSLKLTSIENNIGGISCSAHFKSFMRAMIFKSHEILGTIIYSVPVTMMRSFFWFKIAPDLSFNHKAMFQNIILFSFKRMIRRKRKNVSLIGFRMPPLPINLGLMGSGCSSFFSYFRGSFVSTRLHECNINDFENKINLNFKGGKNAETSNRRHRTVCRNLGL